MVSVYAPISSVVLRPSLCLCLGEERAGGCETAFSLPWAEPKGPALSAAEGPTLRLDVAGANRDQLVLAGVPEENIYACGLCTAMHLDVLTSFRAEKDKAGRIAGIIRARG